MNTFQVFNIIINMGMDKYGWFMQYVFIISETIVNRVWKVDMFYGRDVSRGGHRVAPAPPQNILTTQLD